MAILNERIKVHITTLLAQYHGYSEVARLVSKAHGVSIDRFQVRTYDPTSPNFAAGERWRALFDRARRSFVDDIASIPIAHKAYRLNELQKIYWKAVQAQNLELARATLRQAAKEVSAHP